MTVALTKKVRYAANERLDLNDKTAEWDLGDAAAYEWVRGLVVGSVDGRVFFGWRTTTTTGANGGFTIAAEAGLAVSRDGAILLRDGGSALTSSLSANTISYVHAHYDEANSDTDSRRFYISGSEVSQNTETRVTRTCGIHVTTTAYGGGTPSFSSFQATALIGGKTRQLIPLYAVAINGSNTITGVFDYRPMFAPGIGTATGNLYGSPGGANPDFAHNFAPTNVATIGITDLRASLVAITDRLKQIKGTTHWYDDNFNNIVSNPTYGVVKSTNTDVLTLAGGNLLTTGAIIKLFGGAHGSTPNQAFYDSLKHTFRSQDGLSTVAIVDSAAQQVLIGLSTGVSGSALQVGGSTLAWPIRVFRESVTSGDHAHFLAQKGNGGAAVVSGMVLGGLSMGGRFGAGASDWATGFDGGAQITAYAAENWTVGARGAYLSLLTVVNGATSLTERLRIDQDGAFQFHRPNFAAARESYVHFVTDNDFAIDRFNDTFNVYFKLRRARGTGASPANVQAQDALGTIYFTGYYGGSWYTGASIAAYVGGTPGANDMPARLVFATSADGTASPVERMRLTSEGKLGIGEDVPADQLHIRLSTASTSGEQNVVRVTALSTGQMVDGFGPRLVFYSKDADLVEQLFGSISGVRVLSSDTLGALVLRGGNAGSPTPEGVVVAHNGFVGIGTISSLLGGLPAELTVRGNCFPSATDSYDLGGSSYYWRRGYLGDLKLALNSGDPNAAGEFRAHANGKLKGYSGTTAHHYVPQSFASATEVSRGTTGTFSTAHTVAANTLRAGSTIRVKVGGHMSAGAPGTFSVRVRLGGVSLGEFSASVPSGDTAYDFDGLGLMASIGVSGAIRSMGWTSGTIDTTANLTLDVEVFAKPTGTAYLNYLLVDVT